MRRALLDRTRARGQSGFVVIAGLAVWMLVGGVLMLALLGMTTSATLQATRQHVRAQQARAVDGALETAIAQIQIDPSGRMGQPTGKDDGTCEAGLANPDDELVVDDGVGNVVVVTATCWGSAKKGEVHLVELDARLEGTDDSAGSADLEVVKAKGPGNNVTVLAWSVSRHAADSGSSVPSSSTTTTAPAEDVTWSARVTSEWQTGSCVEVTVTNTAKRTRKWTVQVPVEGTIDSFWNGAYTRDADTLTVSGADWNASLKAGESTSFGFCTTVTATTTTTTTTTPVGDVTWSSRVTSEWQSGYCVEVTVTNTAKSTQKWTVQVPVKGTISSFWNGTSSRSGDTLTVSGVDWNKSLKSGESTSFGFCSNF